MSSTDTYAFIHGYSLQKIGVGAGSGFVNAISHFSPAVIDKDWGGFLKNLRLGLHVCSGQTFEFGMHPLPPSIGCTLSISPRRSGRIHWFCDLGSRPFDNCPVLLFPGLASARNEGLRQLFNARGNASRGSDLIFVFELKLRATYTVENRRSNLTPAKPFPA